MLLFSKFNDAVIDHEEIKEFVAEPWFILLMAGIVTLMVVLLAAVLFVRYRQLGAKKSHLGGTYFFEYCIDGFAVKEKLLTLTVARYDVLQIR